jgi:hypothetical protein
MKIRFPLLALLLLSLPACEAPDAKTHPLDTSLHRAIGLHSAYSPRPDKFLLCHGYGCRLQTEIRLSPQEWNRVAARFSPATDSARKEREQIRQAIALLERMTGPRAGTDRDIGGTFSAPFSQGQMDCEDEMLNAGTYLIMLEKAGLLRFHHIAGQAHRGYFLNGWPHMAVLLKEKAAKRDYVLDSWFHNNGIAPEILDADSWRGGWRPGDAKPQTLTKR